MVLSIVSVIIYLSICDGFWIVMVFEEPNEIKRDEKGNLPFLLVYLVTDLEFVFVIFGMG